MTFDKSTAGKTATLLDQTQLGANTVTVKADPSSASDKDTPIGESPATGSNIASSSVEHDNDVDQEDKPRSRIIAEYLAHGYVISDKAIEHALALDQQHGISTRFTKALQDFDSKYNATERVQQVDKKLGVTENANKAWATMYSYFDKASDTPSGRKLHNFYQQGSKQVLDVHNEARRLATLKTGRYEPEPVSGTDGKKTHCGCGGETSVCGCAPGKCSCASCPRNTDAAASEKTSSATA